MPERVYVCIGIDVEEEGLFRGRYATRNLPLANLAYLRQLLPLLARGARPTLFCAHCVFASAGFDEHVAPFAPRAEIGAHLHHWNTPPLAADAEKTDFLRAVPANAVPPALLMAKLQNLLAAGRQLAKISSFRMGRWDLQADFLPVLAANGITVDASMRPLHDLSPLGPDHFDIGADPFRITTAHGVITEAPLTVVPLLSVLARLPKAARSSLRHWGALALLCVEHPLSLLRLTTNLHISRGGRFISLAWHSSEMMPGGNPKLPGKRHVDTFLAKINRYLDWLEGRFAVDYIQMRQIPDALAQTASKDDKFTETGNAA